MKIDSIFDDKWKTWIWTNISKGCSKDEIFKILHDEGFEFDAIKQELSHVPDIELDQIENPLFKPVDENNLLQVPNSKKIDTNRVELYTFDDFLNKQECDQLIQLIRKNLTPSIVVIPGELSDDDYRTSSTCFFTKNINALVADVDDRICQCLSIKPSYGEDIQGQYYAVGEEFKAHTDFFTPDTKEFDKYGAEMGQRTWTFMIYLNDVESGGETEFMKIGEKITPKRGMAVFWNNLRADGGPNQATMHQALPVEDGFKAIITKWFRVNSSIEPDPLLTP